MRTTYETFNRHVLCALDGSDNSRRAVGHVAGVLSGCRDFTITLLHVIAEPDPDYFGGQPAKRLGWMAEQRKEAQAYLDEYRDFLVETGHPPENVTVLVKEMDCPSISACILAERERLGASILVLGRQGKNAREELLLGSVSKRVVHHAKDCAIWVVT